MAYSYCPVGTAPLRADLAASCGDSQQLLFAGEATHPTKASFAHGALEEGERAAMEVLVSPWFAEFLWVFCLGFFGSPDSRGEVTGRWGF